MLEMVTWLAVKTFLKKALAWCKKYWQILVGAAIPIVIWLLTRRDDDLKKVLANTIERYEKEIEAIEDSHKKELEGRDAAVDKYLETIKKIEKEYEDRSEEISSEKRAEIEKILKESQDDPEEITRRLSELTGISIGNGK